MGRRKKGRPVNGWLILDKPQGLTSTKALSRVKSAFDAKKAGHAGTLDPLATGVLPIAFGEATKTVSHAVDGIKRYRFTVRWGAQTTTDDSEGEIVETSDNRPERADIVAALDHFIGDVSQVPPAYSAIKVDGQRAYDLARDGEEVRLRARTVSIDALDLVDVPDANSAVFEATCGKGTYVRALARDIGAKLGCLGHISALRRTRVGPFDEVDAIGLEDIIKVAEADDERRAELYGLLRPCQMALGELTELDVSPADAADIALGRAVLIRGRDAPLVSGACYAACRGQVVALGHVDKGAFRPDRVFNMG